MREVKSRLRPLTQPPEVRRSNFDEITEGVTLAEAVAEARRCILCKNPRCETACPLHNRITGWMAELQQGRVEEAYRILRETSPMPELCCRLCPQERLCEGACALGVKHEAVAIGVLERFVADQSAGRAEAGPRPPTTTRKRVAAVGSGPAGLAFAQRMACAGHEVTVFERWPRVGGVLRWIPRFKLPRPVLERHAAMLQQWGVRFVTGTEVRSVEALRAQGFDAVFLGVGASRPSTPRLPGVELDGIMSSTEFLARVYYDRTALPNGWQPLTDLVDQRVVVVGGGDSAMDCARTALRLGAGSATCVYRRDEANMPGSKKEVQAAKDEGVEMQWLTAPIAFHAHPRQSAPDMECIHMELGPPDASGRRSPAPIEGATFTMEAELIVLALGYDVEPVLAEHAQLAPTKRGTMTINPATGATPLPGIVAGGDCVTGPGLASTAARSGVVAAEGLLRYFAGESWDALAAPPAHAGG